MRMTPVKIGIHEYIVSSGIPTKIKSISNKNKLVIVEKNRKSKIPRVCLPRIYLSTKLEEAQNNGASKESKIQFIKREMLKLYQTPEANQNF